MRERGHDGMVQAIDLVIGRLSGVHVDSIRFAFEILGPDSIAAGAALRSTQPPAVIHCGVCSAHQETADLVMRCPACGSGAITITGGRELILQTIELQEPSS